MRPLIYWIALTLAVNGAVAADDPSVEQVIVDPPEVALTTPDARFALLVHGKASLPGKSAPVRHRLIDLTARAGYRSLTPGVVSVSDSGVLRSVADGVGQVEVVAAGQTKRVRVRVSNANAARRYHFENDIVPILSRFGCNSSGCHGKAEGQNGFKLSVFGFDPAADYDALTKEGRGRRVFPAVPHRSLLLQKSSGGMPHGGGVRIEPKSPEYATLRGWIAAGLPRGAEDEPKVVSIRLTPRERVMSARSTQRLRVVARYSDGHEEDVTPLAKFQTNNDSLATVDDVGLVATADIPGQAAIMASYMGAVDVFGALIPRGRSMEEHPEVAEHNFIDAHVNAHLEKLNIAPSEVCDDATYLRRVFLDIIGTLPTAEEARAFLADRRADKRRRVVEELFDRSEYADYWALVWSDLLRVEREALGHKQAYAYYRWIRESFAANKPLDRFAREILTAEGPLSESPQGSFYRVLKRPGDMASTFSQVFLGVRIACAECHHHPFDRWSQRDYYGMVGQFAQVKSKPSARGVALFAEGSPAIRHPRTGQVVLPYALGAEYPAADATVPTDRRRDLAAWLTAEENPWFARNMANRVWARLLGRGIIHPVDDVRDTNPPTNPALLDALARHLRERGYDQQALIRAITASRTYQLSTTPNETNARDEQNYSRALLKRIDAEVLLDAVCQATGVREKFDGFPVGRRAIQLWDNRSPHDFLKLFGRPVRETACECERNTEASIAQVLHLMNSPRIFAKITHDGGRVAALVNRHRDDGELTEAIYLTIYARPPTAEERATAVAYLAAARSRRRGAEDLAWSLMNTLEFVFNH